jgi:hypothetical protein
MDIIKNRGDAREKVQMTDRRYDRRSYNHSTIEVMEPDKPNNISNVLE